MKVISTNDIDKYIGVDIEPTDWFVVNQDQINQFADCTLDHQFIHTDPAKARATMFKSTIAHGLLSLSMLPVNSRIRAHAKLIAVDERKPGQYVFSTEVVVEIEGETKPALSTL